jgi:ATP-binding cassette subfamily G (WHITE) protein 2 (PDR)
MAEETKEYMPVRTEHILTHESSTHHAYPENEIEKPEMTRTNSSADVEESDDLKRTQSGRSIGRERTFEPIGSGDREELKRIASNFGGNAELVRTATRTSTLERRDTLAGINFGDAVLDPSSKEFDVYKWARM